MVRLCTACTGIHMHNGWYSGRCAALDNVQDTTKDKHRHHFTKEKTLCPPHYVESAENGLPAVRGNVSHEMFCTSKGPPPGEHTGTGCPEGWLPR